MEVSIDAAIPGIDLFLRDQPASLEGDPEAWRLARAIVDFGSVYLASQPSTREERRIQDAVLGALLRRALITSEAIIVLLEHGLQEPAMTECRTLLDIDLAVRLIVGDRTGRMAKRLAASHYLTYQKHGQDILANRATRVNVLTEGRVPELIQVAKNYARHFESDAFNEVREEVLANQYWHGFQNVEAAFRAVGREADYHMTYGNATWFVHAANVDHDFVDNEAGDLKLKPLVERDPRITHMLLSNVALRQYALLGLIIAERGLPDDPAFHGTSEMAFADGTVLRLKPYEALGALAMAHFDPRSSTESSV